MSELFHRHTGSESERDSKTAFTVRPIGCLALALTGGIAGKRLIPHAKPAALEVLNRLDVVERDGHPQMVNTFKALAESVGVTVQDEHLAYWRSVMNIARAIDDLVDDGQVSDLSSEIATLLRGEPIPGISEAEAEEFFNIVMDASETRHDSVMEGLDVEEVTKKIRSSSDADEIMELRREEGEILARSMNTTTEMMRTTSDPKDLIRLRRKEGAFFGRVVTLENPNNDPSIEKFNDLVVRLCITGYLLDSFLDLADDHKNAEVAVVPDLRNYITLGKEVMSDGMTTLSHLSSRTVASLAIVGLQHAVRKSLQIQAPQPK